MSIQNVSSNNSSRPISVKDNLGLSLSLTKIIITSIMNIHYYCLWTLYNCNEKAENKRQKNWNIIQDLHKWQYPLSSCTVSGLDEQQLLGTSLKQTMTISIEFLYGLRFGWTAITRNITKTNNGNIHWVLVRSQVWMNSNYSQHH